MTQLFLPVEWKKGRRGRNKLLWSLKPKKGFPGIGYIYPVNGKYFNTVGKILRDDDDMQKGYDSLEGAQKAVEEYYSIKHVDISVNNPEVTNA